VRSDEVLFLVFAFNLGLALALNHFISAIIIFAILCIDYYLICSSDSE